MQIVIEKIENGFLVVVQDQKGRKVYATSSGAEVVNVIKTLVDPSPIQVPSAELTVAK